MKVEIVSCPYQYYWYLNHIGEVFDVKEHPLWSDFYTTGDFKNGYGTIRKEDCREVFEVIVPFEKIQEVIQSPNSINYYKYAGEEIYIQKSICRLLEKQEKEMKQEFTKSDLKNFMRVKYRNGDVRIYMDGRLYDGASCRGYIEYYDENLICHHRPDTNIAAVFEQPCEPDLSIHRQGKLIWERKEKSEQEIELEKLQEQIKALEKQAQKLKETMQK